MWELQNACFGYLKLGGRCSSTPAGLLAGLIPSPMTLVGHFFAVAFYGVFKMITREPIYMLPIVLFNCFRVLLLACVVIGPVLMSEMKS